MCTATSASGDTWSRPGRTISGSSSAARNRGKASPLYLVRVLSERDPIRFRKLIEEVVASRNMRKQYVLAVVDDEDELTYYEIKLPKLADACSTLPALSHHEAMLIGKSAMVGTPGRVRS